MVLIRCFTYNHEAYIEDALKGFVMQKTNFPFVAVVVDDASTDGTADIIRKYEKEYPDIIKGIYLKENHYSQKKKKAPYIQPWRDRCKYEALCEGDDYWIDPLKLQKQVDFLEKNPEYVLSYTNRIVVNENKKRILSNNPSGRSGNIFKYLLFNGNPITTASTCFKIKDFQKANEILKKEDIKGLSMGDFPLWISMTQLGKFHYLNDKTVAYRILKKSASHSDDYMKVVKFSQDELNIKKKLYYAFTGKMADYIFEKEYYKVLIRKMAKYKWEIFYNYYNEGIMKFPILIFNPKLLFFFLTKFFRVQ